MVDAYRYSVTGPLSASAGDPALVPSGAGSGVSGGGAPSGSDPQQRDGDPDTASLGRLAQRVEALAERLDALMNLIAPQGEKSGEDRDTASREAIAREIESAVDALIYTDFFQKAVDLGMSPNMVADAYRLADLTNVTANLETKEVNGTNAAVNSLMEKKPYLFIVHQGDIGSETNPIKGTSSYPEEVEGLARTLGVSPEFAAALVKKRSDKVSGNTGLSDIWRIPRTNRLSFLETNE